MASTTANYGFTKPDKGATGWDVDLNKNFDDIDAQIKARADEKVDKVTGKGLSTNDYTTEEKTKLAGIEAGAEVNVIETVKVNGTPLTVTGKAVDVPAPNAIPVVNNLTSTSTTSALSAAQGKVLKDLTDAHIDDDINTEAGVHGLRWYNDVLQFFNGTAWVEIETGGSGIPPSNVINPSIQVGNGQLIIKWTDPNDTVVDGQTISTWAGTKLVRKAGSFPTDEKDGIVLVDNKVRGAYASTGFVDSGLTNGTTYYYQLFPYNNLGAANKNTANRLSTAPQPYRIMTATIDLSNSNPESSVTYSDDAVGMIPGDNAWDEFFGHYPCILKDGVEGVRLNPNDYTKDVDGNTVNLASSTVGDVMVGFPRRGVKINIVGTTVTIQMTDDPDNADFEYYAHKRGSVDKDIFYLGAYKGFLDGSKLRSWSGKLPKAEQTIGTFRTQAQANGAGYDQSGFYQLIFRQCMYLLKYKNLDSQTAVGRGYVDGNTAAIATGGTDKKGMDFGETTGKLQMKLFGLEDFWGNISEWIDGLFSNSTRNILTATENFNDTGANYVDNGQGATANISGYMSKIQGSSETGFITKKASGSETTYFCDYASLAVSCLPIFGGSCSHGSALGAFCLGVDNSASSSSATLGGRLMYL
mgnify:CR=1 FL=1